MKTFTCGPVGGIRRTAQVASSYSHTLAVKSDGTVWAWGWNEYGQLGDGTTTNSLTPKQVLTGVVSVAAGAPHILAVKSGGTLRNWGWNESGQLGDEAVSQRLTPGQLTGLTVRL